MTDQHHLSDLTFAELELLPSVAQGIADAGFERCTPIQASTLPIALSGRDVAGQAQTGTGKTAAFLVALFQHLLTRESPPTRGPTSIRAICIAPTRELAVQIHKDAEELGRHTGLRLAVVFGGVDYDKQRRQLAEGVDVLIGTPGRIIDYYKQHVYDLRFVQVAVLDEADRMFDLGFIADIRYILRRLPAPEHRQSMLFSATLSQRVLELAYEHMNEPELIRIEPEKITADRVRQLIYYPSMEEKMPLLISILRHTDTQRTMVFVNTKRMAERLEEVLRANGINAQALSGDVPQNKRLRFLKAFHDGELQVLIATDVASRGLHIPDVSHVINFDLPQDAADYVHRIGRTARAGAAGEAISFACEEYAVSLPDIEQYIGRKIPFSPIEPGMLAPDIVRPPRAPWRPEQRGGFGRGGSSFGRGGGGGSGRGRGPAPDRDRDRGRRSGGPPRHESRGAGGPAAATPGPGNLARQPAAAAVVAPAVPGQAPAGSPAATAQQGADGAPRKRRRRGGRGRGRGAGAGSGGSEGAVVSASASAGDSGGAGPEG